MTQLLATTDQLEDRMGVSIDQTRALAVLADASAAVVAYSGQTFHRATTTVTVRVPPSRVVRLGQRPVHSVDTVTDLNDNPLLFEFDGVDRVTVARNLDTFACEPWPTAVRAVKVTYDHGYDTIPGDVVAVVCQVAGRAYGVTPQDSGFADERLGDYSSGVRAAAASGALGLLLPERAVLDRYSSGVGTIGVGR